MSDFPVFGPRAEPARVFKADGSCLIVLMRHLGDVVIASGIINALREQFPGLVVDILGKPELKEVATAFSQYREFIEIEVPCFGHHRKGATAMKASIRTLRQIRRREYDFCINTIGDIRENMIGRVTGAHWNIAPVWERGHLFKRKMTDRGASWMTNKPIMIPSRYSSYYESMDFFARQLGLPGLVFKTPSSLPRTTGNRLTVALHPGASHPSRHWPEEKWRRLVSELVARGCIIKILGAAKESQALFAAFGKEAAGQELEILTGNVSHFVSCLATADVLVGMDSFSVHAAYALGIPAVVLNGSADPAILTPPRDTAVSAGHLCRYYPCYYSYPCQRRENEYVCVRGIEVSTVLSVLNATMARVQLTDAT
jgi:heptosyltransferase-3